MPYYKRYPSRYRRKRKYKRRNTIQRATVVRGGQVVRKGYRYLTFKQAPLYRDHFTRQRLKVKLKYNESNVDINPTASGPDGFYTFSFNSIYDPNESGVGHQAMHLDYYSQFYNRYRVNFSVMKVTCINHMVNTKYWNGSAEVSTPNHALKMCIIKDLQPGTDLPTYYNEILELQSPLIKTRIYGPSLTGKLPTMKMTCKPWKVANLDYNDDTLSALTNDTPAREIFGTVILASATGDDPPSYKVNVNITYYVEFFDPKINQSES